MRITKISVKKLFGVFDHEIPLNQESRITIIHGPNGVGKTVLLRMVHGLFNRRYKIFAEIPFADFSVEFVGASIDGDGKSSTIFTLKKNCSSEPKSSEEQSEDGDPSSADKRTGARITAGYRYHGGTTRESVAFPPGPDAGDIPVQLHRLIDRSTSLERIAEDTWFDPDTDSTLTFEDILDTYDHISDKFPRNEPEWYADMLRQVNAEFIETQRLQQPSFARDAFPYRYFSRRESSRLADLSVEKYARSIVEAIKNVSTAYAEESQRIDRIFPQTLDEEWRRLKLDDSAPRYDRNELNDKLNALENKRTELMKLGLFQEHEAPPFVDFDEDLAWIFSVHADDVEDKFSVYDDIAGQLQMLSEIINKRFQHKSLRIDKQEGFLLEASDGSRIPIGSLSSGEQHELVLFYRLLFEVKPHALIAIDEPEISLHVNWQEKFLEDIQRISQLRGIDIIIATHSPDIMSGHTEWAVGLGTPENH